MPSAKEHATMVELIRTHPALASALLRYVGLHLPEGLSAEIVESTFPVSTADTYADAVVVLRNSDTKSHLVVVVEVQLSRDPTKHRRWLTYYLAAENRHQCQTVLLVVAPNEGVARWARRPHAIGPHGNFTPFVLGPEEIPREEALTDKERSSELLILSLLAHRRQVSRPALRAVGTRLLANRTDQNRMYFDLLHATFGEALLRAVEDMMAIGEPLSDMFKAYYRDGKAEGEAKGKAESILAILSTRDLLPSPEQRSALLACTDLERLDRWVIRAFKVASIDELLSEP
jgi:hypothetical protein